MDIGGGRGRLLTNNVRGIHTDFQCAAERFRQASRMLLLSMHAEQGCTVSGNAWLGLFKHQS